jgi:hypothetical protein
MFYLRSPASSRPALPELEAPIQPISAEEGSAPVFKDGTLRVKTAVRAGPVNETHTGDPTSI